MKQIPIIAALVCILTSSALAQEPQVLLDNARVHVTRVKLGPHQKAVVPSNLESVIVYVTGPKAGKTLHSMPPARTEENASDQPMEFVVIELKTKAPGSAAYRFPADDPTKIDPKFHTVDFENDRVRVLRTVLEPHIKAPMHSHPAYVVVYLTDLHTKMAFPDGTVNDNRRTKGDVAWRDALVHSTENVEDQRAAEIQVEMK